MPGYANPFEPPPGGTPPGQNPFQFPEEYYLNQDPDAAFWRYLQMRNWNDPNIAQNRYAQNQQGRVYNNYKATAAAHPEEGFYDYLKRTNPDLQGDYMAQSPESRGDFSSRMLTPRARWVVG